MHSPDKDEGTPSFLLMSSTGNVLAKPETQEQRTRHVTPVLSYKVFLALYYYTNPAIVAISLHITSMNRLCTTLTYYESVTRERELPWVSEHFSTKQADLTWRRWTPCEQHGHGGRRQAQINRLHRWAAQIRILNDVAMSTSPNIWSWKDWSNTVTQELTHFPKLASSSTASRQISLIQLKLVS
jgi:hypothetical protein